MSLAKVTEALNKELASLANGVEADRFLDAVARSQRSTGVSADAVNVIRLGYGWW